MTDSNPDRSVELPASLPFMLNMALAAGLGAFVGGWAGAAIGALLLVLVFGLVWLVGYARRQRKKLAAVGALAWRMARPIVGLIALPLVILLSVPVISIAWVISQATPLRKVPSAPVVAPLAAFARRSVRFVTDFFRPAHLPGTAANLLLLLTLGCVAVGIEVAFYAALAAVPVMILTFAMVALEFSREPTEE